MPSNNRVRAGLRMASSIPEFNIVIYNFGSSHFPYELNGLFLGVRKEKGIKTDSL